MERSYWIDYIHRVHRYSDTKETIGGPRKDYSKTANEDGHEPIRPTG